MFKSLLKLHFGDDITLKPLHYENPEASFTSPHANNAAASDHQQLYKYAETLFTSPCTWF
jgi:hypothetical protein